MVSLAQPGRTERKVLGSTAYPESKDRGDNSLLLTRQLSEDMWGKVSLDPRDKGKTGLFETQSPIGTTFFPIATMSESDVTVCHGKGSRL